MKVQLIILKGALNGVKVKKWKRKISIYRGTSALYKPQRKWCHVVIFRTQKLIRTQSGKNVMNSVWNKYRKLNFLLLSLCSSSFLEAENRFIAYFDLKSNPSNLTACTLFMLISIDLSVPIQKHEMCSYFFIAYNLFQKNWSKT